MNLKFLFLLVLLAKISPFYAQGSSNDAVSYMSELTDAIFETKTETWQYLKAVTRGKGARKVESKRQKLLKGLLDSKKVVETKPDFESDIKFRDAVVGYLELTHTVLSEDFDKILDMEDIAEQSYDLMEAYLLAKEKASEKLDAASDKMQVAQKVFASEHNITLLEGEDDKTEKKIAKASEALSYYNKVYLIFFKCYKQEMYVLDAIQRNDLTEIEQNTSTLTLFANEGLKEISKLEGFHGDKNLIYAVKEILTFYKEEAENDFTMTVDFLIKKDNFEKLNKLMESKGKKKRTQEDVDQFNKAVAEYNEAVEKYNKISETSNETRSKKLNLWNSKVEKFFDSHA